jgi:hypothetical protein
MLSKKREKRIRDDQNIKNEEDGNNDNSVID